MPGFASLAREWWMPVLFVLIAGHITNICVTLFLIGSRRIAGCAFRTSCRCQCGSGCG